MVSFSFQELSYAAPFAAVHAASVSIRDGILADPLSLEVSSRFASLQEGFAGTNGKLIIHIEDPHANLSGQKNIASVLTQLLEKYGISTVLSEGGSGDCSLSALTGAAASPTWTKAGDHFMVQGMMTAEEYVSLTNPQPLRVIGVEDMALYKESVERYSELAGNRQATLDYLVKVRAAVDQLKKRYYPKDFLDYDTLKNVDKAGPEASLRKLTELAASYRLDMSGASELVSMAALFVKEKQIDFASANIEQMALVEALTKSGRQGELKNVLAAAGTQDRKTSNYAVLKHLEKIASEAGIPTTEYPNLPKYREYLEAFVKIRLDRVFEESARLEDSLFLTALKAAQTGTDVASVRRQKDARLLRAIDRFLYLMEVAYRIQMCAPEFDRFRRNEADFGAIPMIAFINRRLSQNGCFDSFIPYSNLTERSKDALIRFYDSVSKRDEAFVANAEQILQTGDQKAAVLITGGYHTPNLKRLLREKGFSYAVLRPVVTTKTNQKRYENLLLDPFGLGRMPTLVTGAGIARPDKSLAELDKDLMHGAKTQKDGLRALLMLPEFRAMVESVEGWRGASAEDVALGVRQKIEVLLARNVSSTAGKLFQLIKWALAFEETDPGKVDERLNRTLADVVGRMRQTEPRAPPQIVPVQQKQAPRPEAALAIAGARVAEGTIAPPTEARSVAPATSVALVGCFAPKQPQLALTSALYVLSGHLKSEFGDQVRINIYDSYADHSLTVDSIVDDIVRNKPKIVGLSIVAYTLPMAKELFDRVNARLPAGERPIFALGNTVASYLPQTLLTEYFPGAIAILGEGEKPLEELVRYAQGTKTLEQIPNAAFYRGAEYITTPLVMTDMDKIHSPDMDEMLRLARGGAKVFIEASRGCPWGGCNFCPRFERVGLGSKTPMWRPKSIKQILLEVEALMRGGVTFFDFSDEDFVGPGIEGVKRVQRLAQEITRLSKRTGKTITFGISCRTDALYRQRDSDEVRAERKKMMLLLKEAGLTRVFLGIESGSQSQ
ncbi:MAG: radical SAM protein, partial [Candidatus Omnitrophota bacterium]